MGDQPGSASSHDMATPAHSHDLWRPTSVASTLSAAEFLAQCKRYKEAGGKSRSHTSSPPTSLALQIELPNCSLLEVQCRPKRPVEQIKTAVWISQSVFNSLVTVFLNIGTAQKHRKLYFKITVESPQNRKK